MSFWALKVSVPVWNGFKWAKKALLTFDQDPLVFFSAKIGSWSGHSLYLNSVSVGVSIRAWLISECHWKLWVGTVSPGFLTSQGSHPASRDLMPCVPVEAFLSRGHVDADGFLERQWHLVCQLLSSPPIWWSGGPSKHALLLLTFLESLSGRHLDAPSASLRSFMQEAT